LPSQRFGIFLLLPCLSFLPTTLCATLPAAAAPEATQSPLDTPGDNQVDRAQKVMSKSVNDAAKWVDSFFADERYVAEEAYSRVRLSPTVFVEEGEAAEFKFRVNAKVRVPKMSKKLRLVLAGNADDDEDGLGDTTFPDRRTGDDDSTSVGLQYFFRSKNRLNSSVSVGMKIGSNNVVDFYLGPRLRKTWELDSWQLRFTERVRWYTDIGWESRTRFDLERLLNHKWFFRGTFDLRWRDEDYTEDGFRYDVGPALTQRLRNKAAIEYQWVNTFKTRPNHSLDQSWLRVRYRQRIWRKWLFYEISPQAAFRNEDDFRVTPGIEFKLEASFGGLEGRKPKREKETSPDTAPPTPDND